MLGEADTSGKVSFQANLDLAELRRYRANASANLTIWDEPRAYADWYEKGHGLPGDLWAGDPQENPYANFAAMKASLDRFYSKGIYPAPRRIATRRRNRRPQPDLSSEGVPPSTKPGRHRIVLTGPNIIRAARP